MLNIDSLPQIDESNYLEVDPRKFKRRFPAPGLNAVLDYLWNVSKALRAINNDGAMTRLQSAQNYYLEVIRWLAGQQATASWVALNPITAQSPSWQNEVENFMNNFLPNLRNTLSGNPVFAIYYEKVNAKPLRGDVFESLLQELELEKADGLQKLDDETQKKIQTISSAAALENWQKYFDELIGKGNADSVNTKNPFNWRNPFKAFKYDLDKLKDNASDYYRQMKHYKAWKNVWLLSFVLLQAMFIFIYLQVWHWKPSEHLAELLTIKLTISIFVGSLFVSANKNYRIYANLYDQAKFRSTVAKTIQGVILDDSRIAPEHKALLLTVAAQSLFEMKPNGHLTKKETASPMNELVTALVAGNKAG